MTVGADGNAPILTVSEISHALKRTVEGAYEHVRVRGEVSGFKRAASGHLYFALKDDTAVLDAVCWRSTAARLGVRPEDGLEVVARGRLTTYPGRSRYQIVVESLEIAGEGALLKLLEQRRQALLAEGLFDPSRKQGLPALPRVIGVVTSPTGAVLRDIRHRIGERCPTRIIVWPVLVQGETAADQIAAAIRGFNAMPSDGAVPRPDVLIVARGGGSLEDLWAFNEEAVVRAAADSDIPLISAVGHETDTTLIDFASDIRAPTPTAAAEFAVPVRLDLLDALAELEARARRVLTGLVNRERTRLTGLVRGLPDAGRILAAAAQKLDDRSERLRLALARTVDLRRQAVRALAGGLRPPKGRIEAARVSLNRSARDLVRAANRRVADERRRVIEIGRLLDSVSPERVIERGYAVVRGADGRVVSDAAALQPGEDSVVALRDGTAAVRIMATSSGGHDFAPKKRRRTKAPNTSQGDLF